MNSAARNWFWLVMAATPLFAAAAPSAPVRERVSLDGRWEFRLDPEDRGKAERWYATPGRFADSITVPGAWQAQGVGKPAGILRHHYAGAAWYRRAVAVPAGWRGRSVTLRIGGAHRRTTAFVNGREVGAHDGFSAPFSFDVTGAIRPGADNDLVLRIENPDVTIGESPDKQKAEFPSGMLNYIGNWGGIYGAVSLEAAPATQMESVLVIPAVEPRQAAFRVTVRDETGAGKLAVRVSVPGAKTASAELPADSREASVVVALPDAPLWTPETPHLLVATVELVRGGRVLDRLEQRFGLREFSTRGSVLLLNGKPVYLRGYGDDNVEVLTGFPPSSRATHLERLKMAKSFGFNAVRFHSMTPPAEYFEAADEAGMLVMAELPAAYTQYFFAHRDFLKRELHGVLIAHRNHPSLLSLALGNEFNMDWLKTDSDRASFRASIQEFYRAAKQLAPATLIMSNDGFDLRPTDMVSLYTGGAPDRPTLRHEFGQYYCSLPDIGLISQFTGVMRPSWLEARRDWLAANDLELEYPIYLRNSARLQTLGQKYQIESVRAEPGVTGYHYWLAVDFPGGTGEGDSWEEGWFDSFWRPKGTTAAEGAALNSPVLLMIDAGVDRRTLWAGDRKELTVTVSNYGPAPIRNARLAWSLMDGTRQVAAGALDRVNAELGTIAGAGRLVFEVDASAAARKLELVLTLDTGSAAYRNRWSFWAFPRPSRAPLPGPVVSSVPLGLSHPEIGVKSGPTSSGHLLITDHLDSIAVAHLSAGGRVWLMLGESQERRGVPFFPASGGAFGTRVLQHPALAGFPQEGFCDLQFYTLLNGAYPLPVDRWPAGTEAPIGGIRTTSEFLSKNKVLSRVAHALEVKAGSGKLLITTLKFREQLDEAHPEVVTLFDAFLRYAAGPAFEPRLSLEPNAVELLLAR